MILMLRLFIFNVTVEQTARYQDLSITNVLANTDQLLDCIRCDRSESGCLELMSFECTQAVGGLIVSILLFPTSITTYCKYLLLLGKYETFNVNNC